MHKTGRCPTGHATFSAPAHAFPSTCLVPDCGVELIDVKTHGGNVEPPALIAA